MKQLWIGIAAAGLLTSCQQVQGWLGEDSGTDSTTTLRSESVHQARMLRDESITAENAYSDLFLDSAALETWLTREGISGDKADQVRAFYLVRNHQYAWFTSDGATEQARGLWSLYESNAEAIPNKPAAALEDRMDSLLTRDSAFTRLRDTAAMAADTASVGETATTLPGTDTTLLQTELALTARFVELAQAGKGPLTADNFFWMVPRKKVDALTLADSLLHKQDSVMGSGNSQYLTLKQNLKRYYEAARNGGWPNLSALPAMQPGTQHPAVVTLKKRLALTGDYPATDTSRLFSDSLVLALRSVQAQYGQLPTGGLTDSLVQELNVPAQQRVQQILVNLNRALWLSQPGDSSRITINIPSQELVVHADTGIALTMPVIVGQQGSSTMAFTDRITTVVFSPYWNIPRSIVQGQVLPAMRQDPNYLKKHRMEITSFKDSIPEIRQLPGRDNAMGGVKFLFPNSFDIYLHDTPYKNLFAQQNRALSNGCIRVAYPDTLARYILRNQPEWTPEKIRTAMNSGQEQQVTVKQPVPVSITYYTAWADANGRMHFREDLYGYDERTMERMFLL